MPFAPRKACTSPGCRNTTTRGDRCPDCTRGNSNARGYDSTWRRLRAQHLALHPTCPCGAPATDVDHVLPHRGDDRLRLDPRNLQSLCHSCHSRKTATQDGGFGR